jgi:hypothetical protein
MSDNRLMACDQPYAGPGHACTFILHFSETLSFGMPRLLLHIGDSKLGVQTVV